MMNLAVELWPGGFKDNKKTIGQISLANVSGLRVYSNYIVCVEEDGRAKDFFFIRDHYRPDGAWVLYSRILKVVTGEDEREPVPEKYKHYEQAMLERMRDDS